MNSKQIFMGSGTDHWEGNGRKIKDITFCVTEDCNLACKYCYMTGKNSKKKMSLETAKKVVDFILNDRMSFSEGAVVWNLIGGEPFLEIELINQISDYIKQQMFLLDHPWFDAYRFSFSTNGILYDTEKVQAYISKNKGHISIGISVDGNKLKHDLQRVYPNGEGSYEDVVKNVPLWIKQFGNVQTKATYSHEDLPYIKDSIISLWDIGINNVSANVIFEDVWHEGDDLVYETQLKDLADYIIENKLWDKNRVRFFNPKIGFTNDDEVKQTNFCGAGKMLAVDCDGNFSPCIRFLDFSLNNKKGINIGNYKTGINMDKVRPFYGLYLGNQSTNECINCEVATGCAWCSGYNYDNAQTTTVYERAIHICKMHKANVRATDYFWKRYETVTGEKSPRQIYKETREKISEKPRYLQLITEDNIVPHCNYRSNKSTNTLMNRELIEKGTH